MKLSKDAKEHIAAEIAAAFAPKMKELKDAENRADEAQRTRNKEIDDAIAAFVRDTVRPQFMKLLKKLGDLDPEFVNADPEKLKVTFSFPYAGTEYGRCDFGTTDNIGAFGLNRESQAANAAVNALEREIRKRVSYALYEIEVNGRKNTLDAIVRRAIETEIDKLK